MTLEGGAGLLADKPKHWFKQTFRLLTDTAFRRELSEQGRAYAATQTIEEHAWRWWEAWSYAYNLQHGKVKVSA